jgi:hypothetical protein
VPAVSLSSTSTEYVAFNDASSDLPGTTSAPSAGIVAITGTPSASDVSLSTAQVDIAGTSAPPSADQPGNPGSVATNDDRFLSAVWQSGDLWVSNNVGCVPSGDSIIRACMRLTEVATASPSLVFQDNVGNPGQDLYFPAVTMDSAGDLFVSNTLSSSAIYPSANLSGLAAGAATFQSLTIQTGQGLYLPTECGFSGPRWGDYSGAATDPSDPVDVWMTAEYAATSSSNCNWGTATVEATFSLPPPTLTSISPTSGAAGTVVTIRGTALGGGSVDFGTVAATGVSCGPSTCTATAPSNSGTVDVTVTTTAGTSATSPADQFTYLAAYAIGAEGTDGALWVRTDLSYWISLGGRMIAAPAIAAIDQTNGPPVLLYIANSSDHRLYERTLSTNWVLLGPSSTYCLDNPAAVVTGTTLTVACEGSDGALYAATMAVSATGGLPNFSAWAPLGGSLGAGPAVAPVNGTIYYFVTAGFNNGQVWARTSSTAWFATGWNCIGHPAAGIAQDGTTTWFGCQGTDGQLWAGPVWYGVAPQGGAITPGVALGISSAASYMFAEANFGLHSVWMRTSTTGWTDLGGSVLNGVGAVGLS